MPFASLGDGAAIGSSAHDAMNYEMALQGHILLRNEKAMLPLNTTKRTMLVGPMSGGYQCQSGYEDASEGCSALNSALERAANWSNFSSASATDVRFHTRHHPCPTTRFCWQSQHSRAQCPRVGQLPEPLQTRPAASQLHCGAATAGGCHPGSRAGRSDRTGSWVRADSAFL